MRRVPGIVLALLCLYCIFRMEMAYRELAAWKAITRSQKAQWQRVTVMSDEGRVANTVYMLCANNSDVVVWQGDAGTGAMKTWDY